MKPTERMGLRMAAGIVGCMVLALWLATPPAVAKTDVERGQTVFTKSCAPCHGKEAQGKVAPALVPFEMDFQELLRIVREGVEEMGGISAKQVSDDDVEAIHAYLLELTETASKK